MPSVEVHKAISKRRTNGSDDFAELHEWIDAPGKELGIGHRRVRHDLSYIPEVREKFEKIYGIDVIKEFLRHISEDYEDSARKWGRICAKDGCETRTFHKRKFCNKCIRERKK